jgi:hypothetical protein
MPKLLGGAKKKPSVSNVVHVLVNPLLQVVSEGGISRILQRHASEQLSTRAERVNRSKMVKADFLDTDTKISYPYPPKNFVYEKGLAAQPKYLSGQAVLLQKRVCVSLYLYSLCYRGL